MLKTLKIFVAGMLLLLQPFRLFCQSDTVTPEGITIHYYDKDGNLRVKGKNYVTLHYRIVKENKEKIFDSYTDGRPLMLNLNDSFKIQGMRIALDYLSVGDEVKVTVPSQWAFNDGETITIDKLLVLSVTDDAPPEARIKPFDVTGKDTVSLKNGLKYIIAYRNERGEEAYNNHKIKVNYTGYFEDGTIFDSSVEKGVPLEFTLGIGEVIEGWEIGIRLMHTGDKFRFIIPPKLAYGKKGKDNVPPNSTLIFDVELLEIE